MKANIEKENEKEAVNRRSIILDLEDTKQSLIREVNLAFQKGIPCYFLKDILEQVLSMVREGANNELNAERAREADLMKSQSEREVVQENVDQAENPLEKEV